MKKLLVITLILIMLLGCAHCAIAPPLAEPTPNLTVLATAKPKDLSTDGVTATPKPKRREIVLLASDRLEGQMIQAHVAELMEGVRFTFVPRKSEDYLLTKEEILPRLLSNDNSFDVFHLSTRSDYAMSLLQRGYYVDLSVYPKIKEYYDHAFPLFQEMGQVNNEIFGIPTKLDTIGHLNQRTPVIDAIGWTLDDLKTLDDLYAFENQWSQSDQEKDAIALYYDIILDQLIFRHIYNQYDYTTYHANIETAAFEEVLIAAKELYASDFIHKDYEYMHPSNVKNYALVGLYAKRGVPSADMHAPFPQVEGHNDYDRLYADFLVTNPYIEDMDLVVEMYALIAEMQKTNIGTSNMIFPYTQAAYYESDTIDPHQLSSSFKEVDENLLGFLDQYYNKHRVYFAIPGSVEIKEIFKAFLDGHIEMEQAIADAQRILDVTAGEMAVAN